MRPLCPCHQVKGPSAWRYWDRSSYLHVSGPNVPNFQNSPALSSPLTLPAPCHLPRKAPLSLASQELTKNVLEVISASLPPPLGAAVSPLTCLGKLPFPPVRRRWGKARQDHSLPLEIERGDQNVWSAKIWDQFPDSHSPSKVKGGL